jgi:hypothetical protein
MAFDFIKRLFGGAEKPDGVIQIFTPQAASHRGKGTRLVLAGATVVGLVISAGVALSSLLVLLLAVGALYYLLTEVLGLKLDVDPRAFVQRAQEYAQYGRN